MPRKSTLPKEEIVNDIPVVSAENQAQAALNGAESEKKKPVRKPTAKKNTEVKPVEAQAADGKFVGMNSVAQSGSDSVTQENKDQTASEPKVEEKKAEETQPQAAKSRVEMNKPQENQNKEQVKDAAVQPAITQQGGQVNRVVMNQNNRQQYTRPSQTRLTPNQNRSNQTRPMVNNQPRVATAPSYAENNAPVEPIIGVLDIANDGQGFVRPKFTPSNKDAYIAANQIKRIGLRPGDMIVGAARMARETEKYGMIVRIDKVNGLDMNSIQKRPNFNDLVPIFAQKQVKLEFDPTALSTRIIDLFSPIGFGQRGMIVSPPKAGKTTLLKEIAAGVAVNHPEVHLMAVLVGERPEEITDMQRFIKGEVVASSFDQKPEEQTKAAEIAIERAKRLVEMGQNVFMIFDSITRLARAYNLAIPTSGRTLSGGFDPAALYPSKRFFGAARNIENGGSLTIIGTALVDTNSKMDDLIFEEFKGTGNMELRLNRSLAERRIFPAFDVLKSGTRREEYLLPAETLAKINAARRIFDEIQDKDEATVMIEEQMRKTKNNAEFMMRIGKQ